MARKGKPKAPDLAEYRAKRSAERTPEPFSGPAEDRPGLFVVHKHAARNLHFDLRLEVGGVLKSWAVPKGPSPNPEDKRLAVHVEDHPLEYGDFEGLIPEGNYGAGAVIVWDRGLWVPIKDPKHGIDQGKLLFDLRGYKLRGRWTLFKIKRGEKEWLLVKKPDAYATKEGEELEQQSVLSGLTVEELKQGKDRAAKIRKESERLGAPRDNVAPLKVGLMLAQPREDAFTDDAWLFELKYDGYRLIAARGEDGKPLLRYRRGQDVTARFPEISIALAKLPYAGLVLDGEVVVLDDAGKPSFQRLQQRVQLSKPHDIQRASVQLPAKLFVFDLLGFEDFDLRPLPLTERKRLLREVLPRAGPLAYSDHIVGQGEAMYEQVREMRLEGLIAKRADSAYQAGRGGDWLKIRVDRTGDFAIVGHTAPKRGRAGLGALHLALREGGQWVYAGRVGTGFDDKLLRELREALDAAPRSDPPPAGPVPKGDEHTWVEPLLVAEVRYKETTADGQLRHPVFLRLRDDKPLEECVREGAGDEAGVPAIEPIDAIEPEPASEQPVFSNLDKVFWPEEGYTKGDLIDYYVGVSRWLLPYLEDRPVVLTRYPDGIHGKNFFQKDAPEFVPRWVRTETMWSENAEREIRYFICDDERTLAFLANLGTIPLHIWSSRVADLQHPDWCILDLDPKGAPFQHVVKVAQVIRALCREIELPSFVKTSGSSGLHVLVPLAGQCTYEQSRMLGQLLATAIVARLPEIATTARSLSAREGKVYVDFLQNGHGRLLVSPLCVRPLPGAPVSMMLRWSEVTAKLDIGRFTIKNAAQRLSRMKRDPMLGVLSEEPELGEALERLGRLVR